MEKQVFEAFRKLIYDKSGIVLTEDKKTLLASRIQKRLRARSISSEKQYLEVIESDLSGHELVQLIDAVSTNTTYFWREAEHFQVFADILDRYKKEKKAQTRIWCAAASSGQEPYTLAMEVIEHLPPAQHSVKLLATDVSTKVLGIALKGLYSDEEVSKLPADKRDKFMRQASGSKGAAWQVDASLMSLVLFKKLNLVEFPYPLKGPVDVIFCRNVMIYFDTPTRQKIVDEFTRLLAPGGYLFLSLSESLLSINHGLKKVYSSVYQK